MIFKGFRLGMAFGAFCVGYTVMVSTVSWVSDQLVKMMKKDMMKKDEENETDEEK